MPTVLVSALTPPADLRECLGAAEFTVLDHTLGSTPAVDFAPVAVAVIDVGEKPDAAVAQTRRWRIELGDDHIPIVWMLPAGDARQTERGLEAGADAVLARPLDAAVFTAQVKSAVRARVCSSRVAARANEARLLGEHLHKAHGLIDRELAAVRRVQHAFLPRILPTIAGLRFAVSHRSRSRLGGDFYDVRPLHGNHVGFFLADAIGSGTSVGLLGMFAAQAAALRMTATPGEMLAEVNRELLRLDLEDRPMVAMLAGVIEGGTGKLVLARAGLPAPVFIPAQGEPETWAIPGPFLGTADTTYPTRCATLRSGDKLVIGSDGIRPDGEPNPGGDDRLLAAVTRHRERSGQAFADVVAADLLTQVVHEEDFTLMVVEAGC
jgi:phosphoserine phosphatase RsbU/P